MNALYLLIPALCLMAIAYRYYSAFLAARVAVLDDTRVTPAHTKYDGHNYYPLSRWVLFGHHFAAITGAGPLIGPVLAAQFGYLPGMIWLVIGVCIGGAVHDFMVLWASTRRGGRSLAEIAREEIGPIAGVTAAIAILFIIVIALAGLGLAVVNALRDSAWGTFTIAMTIPIAIVMGLYMYKWRKDSVTSATIIGVLALIFCVVAGRWVAEAEWGSIFVLSKNQLVVALAIYGFAASVLPVWLLLAPRDYLSAFMKIGTVGFLIIGVIFVAPTLHMPAVSEFAQGGGPIIPGKVFPFVFITIACGAISGFHGLIGSGTTPKMVNRESDIRVIGYGAMLMEGIVGVVALIAASALFPGDYFGINVPPERFAAMNIPEVNLALLSAQVGEDVAGRPGGAVSLAVGMAQIFTALPGMSGLMSYWYHFAIMFEALFILTTIDAGTRVARFILQEFAGRFYAPLARHDSIPAAAFATLAVVLAWGYFIYAGSISTIWPMFGIANQLLATVALAITTIVLVNAGRARYAWVTIVPMVFVATTTVTAGILSVRDSFWPMAIGSDPTVRVQGYVNTVLTIVMLCCVAIILLAAGMRWRKQWTESTMDRNVVTTSLLLVLLLPAVGYAQPESGLFRLVTFEQNASPRLGATRGDGSADVVDVHNAVLALRAAGASEVAKVTYIPADMRALIESGPDAIAAVRMVYDTAVKQRAAGRLADPGGERRVFHPPASVRLLPPVANPSKMFGLAGNYPREGDLANPKMPSSFLKSVSSLTGPEAPIDLAGLVTRGVHEPELSFVIGRLAKNVPASQAYDYIVGYTICNDVSARDLPQGTHSTQGATFSKGLDTFSPCGPYLTLKEDVPDPHALAIEARLNGQKWELPNANTRHLTFKIPALVEFLSSRMTLLPGDIVQTGVPAPVVPLRAGDTVEITIDRLGTLRNRVVAKVVPGTF